MGHSDHRRLDDGFVGVEHLLDLARIDVEAAAKNHVLLAVHDRVAAVGIPHPDVAGVEPAAAQRLLRGVGSLQVALHDVVSADADLSHGHVGRQHANRIRPNRQDELAVPQQLLITCASRPGHAGPGSTPGSAGPRWSGLPTRGRLPSATIWHSRAVNRASTKPVAEYGNADGAGSGGFDRCIGDGRCS